MHAIRINGLSKTFRGGCCALDGVDLTVGRGEMVALIGSSGSGKSTLMRHIAGLAAGDPAAGAGRVEVFGRRVQEGGAIALDIRRTRSEIGMIFQQFNLVGRLSLLTNVVLGLLGRIPAWRGSFAMFSRAEKLAAMEALARVGIADKACQRASTLSGGQQQRAAIARTLVQRASVLLADEPIASLDPESARRVMECLARVNREDGITVLVCLHQVDYALKYCPRTVAMRAGRIVYDGPSAALTPEFLRDLYGSESEELVLGHAVNDRDPEPAPLPAALAAMAGA